MPLKHKTETAYVCALAVFVAITGILLSWLPLFPSGIVGWMMLLILALAYPLILMPGFKRNRADYQFRRLHLLPLLMVLAWGGLSILSVALPALFALFVAYVFFWSIVPVVIGLLLLGWFCIVVVRQSRMRMTFLAVLFAAYLILGLLFHMREWNTSMRAALEDTVLVQNPLVELLERTFVPGAETPLPEDPVAPLPPDILEPKEPEHDPENVISPPRLPKSGGEAAVLFLFGISSYCAFMQRRAQRRE